MNEWKNKTCENCMYRDEKVCRKFPPLAGQGNKYYPSDIEKYPIVYSNTSNEVGYSKACSYYEETK